MITYIQAIILGLLQGLTELFPVSSLGHSVILPSLLHWNIDQSSDSFLIFIVLTHLATAVALLTFFWKEWVHIVVGFFRSIFKFNIGSDCSAKMAWLIIVGTIPAGLVGLVFQKKIQGFICFASFGVSSFDFKWANAFWGRIFETKEMKKVLLK